MQPYRSFQEKYCPVVGHNVMVERLVQADGHITERCLNREPCSREQGGCRNIRMAENTRMEG